MRGWREARSLCRFSTAFYGTRRHYASKASQHFTWHSSDPSVAAYSSVTGMINTYSPGNIGNMVRVIH